MKTILILFVISLSLLAECEGVPNIHNAAQAEILDVSANAPINETIYRESPGEESCMAKVELNAAEVELIAKTVWGEARGVDKLQQSAVVWCILNRVDSGHWGDTIEDVVTAKNQFYGYSRKHPVDEEIKTLVEDVMTRWHREKMGCADVGRTLPQAYLYFSADGTGLGNVFRTDWKGGETWDWSCPNPYEN